MKHNALADLFGGLWLLIGLPAYWVVFFVLDVAPTYVDVLVFLGYVAVFLLLSYLTRR